MKAEGQCYSEGIPGVPGGGIGREKGLLPAGDICIESRCSVGKYQNKQCTQYLYRLQSPSRCTLNPPPDCSLPWNAIPGWYGPHQQASAPSGFQLGQSGGVLIGDVESKSGRRVRSGYLFPWFLHCGVFMS